MRRAIHSNPMATAGLVVLAAGWIWTAAFFVSGMDLRYPAAWWVQGIVFCCWMFPPVALLLSVGGLVWEDEKQLSWLAIALSLLSAGLIYWIFR